MTSPLALLTPPSVPDVTHGPGSLDVLISEIGGRGALSIEAAEIGATWEVNQAGQLAVDLPLDAVLATWGDPRDLQGKWLTWTGHAAGDWGGKITSVPPKRADGLASLQCSDWTYHLARRFLPDSKRVISGLPGGVAAALLTQAQAIDTLWLDTITVNEEGDFTSVQVQGQNLFDALRQLASDTDQEFTIDADRTFRWARRLGSDLTNSVQLNEGMEIAASSPVFDIADVVNDLTISPAVDRYRQTRAREVVDAASLIAIGRQEGALTTADAVRPAAIRAIGAREVSRSAARGQTVAFDVVDVNNSFAAFRVGDTVRVVIASLDFAEDVRILQVGLVVGEAVLHVTGEVAS